MDVKGKVAIVTGGGSGIGKATVERLSDAGAYVLIADLDEVRCLATVTQIKETGGETDFIAIDATKDEDLAAAFKQAEALWGGVDIVVNNAGMLTGTPAYPEAPRDRWSRVVDLNLTAVIRGTQMGIEALSKRGGGAIVNMASMSGINPWPADPVYSATKAGVVFFTKALAALKESKNIRVNCVCPHLVVTPLLTFAQDESIRNLERFARLEPEHIADAVMKLIEDDSFAGAALKVVPGEEPSLG